MIRSYTVDELQEISGFTRRTISDYIAKGVLGGPSQRGRGARYPQKDLDVLAVLPRIRTLMKKEYPTLKDVSGFLGELSVRDINRLATRVTEAAFVCEARRLRVRNSLTGLLPYVPPERIETLLAKLTPGQIEGIDSGRYQIGAVMDIEGLLQEERLGHRASGSQAHARNGYRPESGHLNGNGKAVNGDGLHHGADASWSVSWLNGHEEGKALSQATDIEADASALLTRNDEGVSEVPVAEHAQVMDTELNARLSEISQRLEKLESILDKA
jgi:hypothetical protein